MNDRLDPAADLALLEAARAGEPRALETLLQQHQAQVYRFGLKMCRDPEDAKDVLQETLLAMARHLGDFRGASSLSTWLFTIARSFCLKKRRKRPPTADAERSLDSDPTHEVQALTDPARTPDEALAGKELEQALEQAIAALDPMLREVLLLRDVEGLTAPEVAQVLGVSVQAVKSRLHRARLAVRARLAPLVSPEAEAPPAAEPGREPGLMRDNRARVSSGTSSAARGTCPDILGLFSRHLEGEIGDEVCREMERHLESCDRCRGACDSLKRTLALCHTAPAIPVPAAVQSSVRVALQRFLAQAS